MKRQLEDLSYIPAQREEWWSDPYGNFASAAERDWIYKGDHGFEVVRYAPVQQLLRNRNFSQEHNLVAERAGIQDEEVQRFRTSFMIATVGNTHVRLRSSVAEFFGKKYIEAIRKDISGLIHRVVDEVDTESEVEIYDAICERVPALTYLYLIDGDYEDEDFVIRMSDSILKVLRRDPAHREEIESAYHELFEYVAKAIERKKGQLGDDFLSHVLRQQESGRITEQEAFDLLVLTLEASTDNTAHQMALVTSVLMEHVDQWDQLKREPSMLEPAVDEAIRYRPRAMSNSRVALSDVVWQGFEIPQGTEFTLSTLAANRDRAVYSDPNTFRIDRDSPPPHLMFGGGMTMCLGSTLARMEIQEFVKVLMERFPGVVATTPSSFEFVPPVVTQTCGVHLVLEP